MIALAALATLTAVVVLLIAMAYTNVAPNRLLIVYGAFTGRHQEGRAAYRLVSGRATFVLPWLQSRRVLDLSTRPLAIEVPEAITAQGVELAVYASAQVRISADPEAQRNAAEQLLGKSKEDVDILTRATLEGNIREICSRLSIEEINADRERLKRDVERVAGSDLAKMGVEVVSFVINDIDDEVGYIKSLGRAETARVQSEAEIGEAEAARDAAIRAAEARKEGEVAKAQAETEVAQAHRDRDLEQARIAAEVEQELANKEVAKQLQTTIRQREVTEAEAAVERERLEREVELEDQRRRKAEQELHTSTVLPAEREAQAAELRAKAAAEESRLAAQARADNEVVRAKAAAEQQRIEAAAQRDIAAERAEAVRVQAEAEAAAEQARAAAVAEGIRARGLAEAETVRQLGLAEAEAMREKAEAWSQYGQEALQSMAIERMPEIATAMASSLAGTEKLIITGGAGSGPERVTDSVGQMMAQLGPVVRSLTGVGVTDLLRGVKPNGRLTIKGAGDGDAEPSA